jgi:hypothetical protein
MATITRIKARVRIIVIGYISFTDKPEPKDKKFKGVSRKAAMAYERKAAT